MRTYVSPSNLAPILRPCAKAPPQAQHQVAGVFESTQLIAHMEEELACDRGLEGQYLIPPLRVLPFLPDVVAKADVDGKEGHHQLATGG